MSAEIGHLVTWEPDGYWARALRRHLPAAVRVWEVSDIVEAPPVFPPDVRSIPCVDVLTAHSPQIDWSLTWCDLWFDPYRPRQTMAVSPDRIARNQMKLWVGGASLVWIDIWELPAICRYIVKFCEKHAVQDLSLEQQIWKNLPWNS